MRTALEIKNGERMRFVATLERYGKCSGWRGSELTTLLLRDVRFAASGELACEHLWFKQGEWSYVLARGDRFEFDARVTTYMKGYQGSRAERLGLDTYEVDFRLERPTKVVVIAAGAIAA